MLNQLGSYMQNLRKLLSTSKIEAFDVSMRMLLLWGANVVKLRVKGGVVSRERRLFNINAVGHEDVPRQQSHRTIIKA